MKSRTLVFFVKVVILAVIYFGTAKLGLLLSFVLGNNTLVWPPTGVALAALLLCGSHLWPGIALGAFLSSASSGVPLAVAWGVSAGNTLEALFAVFLLRRVVRFHNALERLQDVIGLAGLAAGLSTMVSATIDVASFCLGGVAPWEAYGLLWRVWWLGGAMSNLVIAPLILTWSARAGVHKSPRRIAEAGVLLASLVLICLLVFAGWSHIALIHYPLDYIVFPFIIWAALRFGQREAVVATFVVSAIALWGTAHGFGPFVRGTPPERLALLYAFMSVTATTALVLAAIVTARKQAEKALRASEEKYRAIFDTSPDFLYLTDLEGRILDANPTLLNRAGLSLEQIRQFHVLDFFAGENQQEVEQAFEKLKRGQPISKLEVQAKTAQGACFKYEVNAVPLMREEEASAILSLARDITERKQMEAALRESEQRYRAISEMISDYAYAARLEPDGSYEIEWITEAFVRVTGFSPDRKLYQPESWIQCIHPEDLPISFTRVQRLLLGQTDVSEFRIFTKSREVRWIREYGRPVWDEGQNRVTRLYIAGRDITDRKRAEEALRDSEIRHRSIIDAALDAVITMDAAGLITGWNPQAETICGWSQQEVIGQPLVTTIIPLRYREAHERGLRHFLATGEGPVLNKRIEVLALHKDGHEFPVELTITPIRSGETWLFSAFARDLTEHKRAEEERQRLQEQLFQARKLEALGTLADGVAHDFNNILSAIMGFTELATDEVTEGTLARQNLEEVLKASRRAKTLVQQILSFSRPTLQQRESVQVQPIVEEVVTFLRASAPKTIEIRSTVDPSAGPVAVSLSQLQQVLTNLCANATQALGTGGGVVGVGLCEVKVEQDLACTQGNLQPGSYVKLTIRDTGCGMAPEVVDRIFEPFFTTRPVGEGNGLGLAIVHGIVTGHGGGISVVSGPGQGTTFVVYLPVSADETTAESAPSSSAEAAEGDSSEEEKGGLSYVTHFSHR